MYDCLMYYPSPSVCAAAPNTEHIPNRTSRLCLSLLCAVMLAISTLFEHMVRLVSALVCHYSIKCGTCARECTNYTAIHHVTAVLCSHVGRKRA